MSTEQASTAEVPRTASWHNRTLIALSSLGTIVAAYLTWIHYSGQLAMCGGIGNCETVQASRYATLGAVPVALLGLIMYLSLLGLYVWRGIARDDEPEYLPLVLFGISLVGTLFSAYLTYLELFVIHAICPWCVSSAIIITLIFILSIWGLRTRSAL